MIMFSHTPVLLQEVLHGLALKPGDVVIDGTLGLGGHAAKMLDATTPNGLLIGFDRDDRNIDIAKKHLEPYGGRVRYIHDSFSQIAEHDLKADAVLFDLGFSSVHVDDPARGFSFRGDGPLDMRYDIRQELTAEAIVNGWSRDELAELFRKYAEEPKAMFVAKAITNARKVQRITTTLQLADIVSSVLPRRGKTHPATGVFQALRIAVNDELGEVERGVNAAIDALVPGGKIAIITFHSLEDRLIKNMFKTDNRLTVLTKKPIGPSRAEEVENPRSRSAKLRIAQKI